MDEFKMMNSSAYDANGVHQNQATIQHQTHPGHAHHHTNMSPAISSFFHTHPSMPIAAHQHQQLQHPTISTGGSNGRQVATTSPSAAATHSTGIFDPRQMQLANTLEKAYFSGMQTPDQSFFSGVPPSVTTSAASNSVHQIGSQQPHQQQSNTILITNNFSAHQYPGTNPHLSDASSQMLPRAAASIGGVTSAGATPTGSYNNANAANIRIITTLPSALHQPQKPQHQHMYNIAKEIEASVRDDIIQLPPFYHTPHQQSSAYAPHLPTLLPTHFTQQHYTPTTTAPASLQIQQNDQQHQFFVPMSNDGDAGSATAAVLTAAPKLIPTLTSEAKTGIDTVTTSPAMITSPGTAASTNSTLVLDRINICINNHYTDSTANNGLSNALDCNGTSTTASIAPAAHTFSMATHAPQQPSPIIPAIHHKVVLDSVSSGDVGGILNTDSYTSNDSTLVIDEPDSTTTTPHTPPTTPETSSPPPPPTNLAPARATVVPQLTVVQNIIQDTVVVGKENFIAAQTKCCVPATKPSIIKTHDKTTTYTSDQSVTTITQSIDLLDDDESDYTSSDMEKVINLGRDENTKSTMSESVVVIEDNEVEEVKTPETVRILNNTKSGETMDLNKISQDQLIAKLDESKGETDVQELRPDSPPSPTSVKRTEISPNQTVSSVTLLTPPTPTTSSQNVDLEQKASNSPEIRFSMGEDVFIRKEDGRQYLGTVIGSSAGGELNMPQNIQYLIRFDDNSELWCGIEEMRRLGSSTANGNAQMCVACKRTQVQDVVEICDDCRRGYHRGCTRETKPGSAVWWCLRCSKPMKNPPHATKAAGRPLTHHNRNYKSTGDASKTLATQKLKTPADVYEFRIEDSETFTSDDEIPIKHIMEKARKSKDATQNSSASGNRPKSLKKRNSFDEVLCEKIVDLDDENANDANSVSKMPEASRTEKVGAKEMLSSISSKSTNCATSLNQGMDESDIDGKIHVNVHVPKTGEHKSTSSAFIKEASVTMERSSRKRKAFTLSNSYKEVAAEAASKRYDSSRICDSSSDENSSSSRGTSLDVIIPPPKNFLGLNNPFRMVTPKKNSSASHVGGGSVKSLLNFNCNGTMIKSSIFNTTALDFSSKLAALKSAGMFPNLSTSNLAKAAGQPRTVRTIKRRLSAKDITIGPNQEVRRRRTRRLSSNIEIISTTTINPIPSNFFPIHAKDLLSTHTQITTANATKNISLHSKQQKPALATSLSVSSSSSSTSASSSPPGSVTSSVESQVEILPPSKPLHGRRLRQRPQKNSLVNSRRSSISSASITSSTNSSSNITLAALQQQQQALRANGNTNTGNMSANTTSMHDLKQSVKEYFGGVVNRIESGEQFCIRAKRQLANGQMQYLIEWGDVAGTLQQPQMTPTSSTASPTSSTATLEVDN